MPSEELEKVIRTARERLYPSLRNPHWLILRKRGEIFRRWMNDLPPGKLTVLDVGGRLQPYRELLDGRIQQYVAVDIRRTALVNVIGSGEQLPFSSDIFDVVLCTQVLEYVPDPEKMLLEIQRGLIPGGMVIVNAPAAHPRDSDEEYWNFQPAALRRLLAAFVDVEVVGEGGSITGFFRTVNACLHIFARYAAIRFLLSWTVFPIVNVVGFSLEGLTGSTNDQFTVNYSATARKPSGSGKKNLGHLAKGSPASPKN